MEVISNKKTFYELIKDFEHIPYVQSEGWCNYTQTIKPNGIRFFINDCSCPTIACFGHEKTFLWLKLLQIDGECLRSTQITNEQIKSFFKEITLLGYDFIEFNSELPYNPALEIGIREAGYLRPIGIFSNYLTKDIHLQKPLVFSSNWKRNLKTASKHSFSFTVSSSPPDAEVAHFTSMYRELLNDKQFTHPFQELQFRQLLTDPAFSLAWLKNEAGENVTSFIYYQRNGRAQSVFRAKNNAAKKNSATYEMYYQILCSLAKQDCEKFNVNRLTPGTKQGLFDFKNGIEGELYMLCGEFAWYKKTCFRLVMFFVKKFLLKRNDA